MTETPKCSDCGTTNASMYVLGECQACWSKNNPSDAPDMQSSMAFCSALDYPTGKFQTVDGDTINIVDWDKAEGMPILSDGERYFPCCIINPRFKHPVTLRTTA